MKNTVLPLPSAIETLPDASRWLDQQQEFFPIAIAPWKEFSYKPEVRLKIAWNPEGFFPKFYVSEIMVRALFDQPQQPVYKDSCVEFFVMPSDDSIYYNFEFNAIGNMLAAWGTSRNDRVFLKEESVRKIETIPSLGRNPFPEQTGEHAWNLAIFIPFTVLEKHPGLLPGQKIIRANFYKCGDELSMPHYLCWQEIKTPSPDFHRPEFFGELFLKEK